MVNTKDICSNFGVKPVAQKAFKLTYFNTDLSKIVWDGPPNSPSRWGDIPQPLQIALAQLVLALDQCMCIVCRRISESGFSVNFMSAFCNISRGTVFIFWKGGE